jgi:antitoxin ParD1/3/4
MNVSLAPELEAAVKARVDSGRYASASEVIRDALRALDEREDRDADRAELRRSLDVGMEDLRAGRYVVVDDIESFVNERFEAAIAKARAMQSAEIA